MSNKVKVAFVGCSMTLGEGFDPDQREGQIYPSLIARDFMFDHDNLAIKGASNHRIFLRTSEAIRSQRYDIIFCQWSELNRLWLSPAPNSWYYVTGQSTESYRCRDLVLESSTQNHLANLILLLNHDYQNILDLIEQVQVLNSLAQQHQVKLIFINGMLPWQSDLLKNISHVDQLSDWSCGMLDANNRDDSEVLVLLEQLQNKFKSMPLSNWINPFDSFQSITVDAGPQGHHPGPKSHQAMADQIHNYLEQGNL